MIAVALVAVAGCSSSSTARTPGTLFAKAARAGCIWSAGGLTKQARCAAGRAFGEASTLAISPDGAHVYVVDGGSGVAILTRSGDGALAQSPERASCVVLSANEPSASTCARTRDVAQLDGLTFSPDGRNAYASGPTVFDVDRRSGALRAAAGPGACFSSSDTGGACQQLSASAAGEDPLVSPDGRHVYAVSHGDDSATGGAVAIFRRGRGGRLTPLPGVRICRPLRRDGTCRTQRGSRAQAAAAALSPDGRSMYLAQRAGGVTVLDRDSSSGALTQKPGADGCVSHDGEGCTHARVLPSADAIRVSPDGRTVYALATNTVEPVISVLARNTSTGVLRQPPGRRGCIAQHGARDTCTIGGEGLARLSDMALSPDGLNAYVVGDGPGVFDRDARTGAMTPHTPAVPCGATTARGVACRLQPDHTAGWSIAVSGDGRDVYATSDGGERVRSYTRDRAGRRPLPPVAVAAPPKVQVTSPATTVARKRRLDAAGRRAVRLFGDVFRRTSGGELAIVPPKARQRELKACFADWRAAPDRVAKTDLLDLYHRALRSRQVIARDRDDRRVLARLRSIAGVEQVGALRASLDALDDERAKRLAIAQLSLGACDTVRAWRANRWSARSRPREIVALGRLEPRSPRDDAIIERAARLIRTDGGRHARASAQALESRPSYPVRVFPACDPIALALYPNVLSCNA